MDSTERDNLGRIIKQQRVMMGLTLQKLATLSGVSASHLGRIERGERFPSGSILRRIAGPLDFAEDDLFTFAGYLSPHAGVAERSPEYASTQLDPYVARILAQETIEVQRSVISILSVLKSIARSIAKEGS